MQSLIDEANQSLEESGTPLHDIMVIVLHQEFSAGTIGITLAGGRRLRVQVQFVKLFIACRCTR